MNKRFGLTITILFIGISFILIGCNSSNNETATSIPNTIESTLNTDNSNVATPSIESGYPYPVTDSSDNGQPISAYPATNLESEENTVQGVPITEFIVPTPSPGLATVTGILVENFTQLAPTESTVYLGKLIETDAGLPIISLNREIAPTSLPLPDGRFAISDVMPGKYGIILYNPDINFLIDDPQNPEVSLIITVAEDQTLDLGKINISMP